MKRDLYKRELEPFWPHTHWDHWMRTTEISKGRECLYPQVPRNHNIGKEGVHSDEDLYNKYFRDIAFNTVANPNLGDVNQLVDARYDADLVRLIRSAGQVRSLSEFSKKNAATTPNTLVLVFKAPALNEVEYMEMEWSPVSQFFGLWHSIPIRGNHKGLVHFWREGKEVFLIGHDSPFAKEVPGAHIFQSGDFIGVGPSPEFPRLDEVQLVASGKGESCAVVCKSQGLDCDKAYFSAINTCSQLQAAFGCDSQHCDNSFGPDQPCFITQDAPSHLKPGTCLVNMDRNYFSCEGHFEYAKRACPCLPPL